jgi:hypothetical protein
MAVLAEPDRLPRAAGESADAEELIARARRDQKQ